MVELSNALNTYTNCNGSIKITVQVLTNNFEAVYPMHRLHSTSSKHVTHNFQHRHSLVGIITLTYPAYLPIS